LGLACQAHESLHQRFPYTANLHFQRTGGVILSRPSVSPHANLLPFLDQAVLSKKIDFDLMISDVHGKLPVDGTVVFNEGLQISEDGGLFTIVRPVRDFPVLVEVLNTTVPVFLCPSDTPVAGGNNYRACMGFGPAMFAPTPRFPHRENGNGAGAFVHARGTRAGEFGDGLSNTVFFSEKLIGDRNPDVFTPWWDTYYFPGNTNLVAEVEIACRFLPQDEPPHDSYGGTTWLLGGYKQTYYNHLFTPNSRAGDCTSGGAYGGGHGAYTALSFHRGGVNVVLGDGAARLISDSINLDVWRALSTRAGSRFDPPERGFGGIP
jgi:hypothetical protein